MMTDHSEAAVYNEHRNNNGAAGPTKLPVSSSLQGLEALNSETVDLVIAGSPRSFTLPPLATHL